MSAYCINIFPILFLYFCSRNSYIPIYLKPVVAWRPDNVYSLNDTPSLTEIYPMEGAQQIRDLIAPEWGNYQGLKLLDQVMKVLKRVVVHGLCWSGKGIRSCTQTCHLVGSSQARCWWVAGVAHTEHVWKRQKQGTCWLQPEWRV